MTSPHPIPPVETATDPIASAADLAQRWRALMGPLGFGERLLRFAFVGPDRRFIKVLHDVEVPREPRLRQVEDLFSALRTILDDLDAEMTVALLLTRPGRGPVSECDRRWGAALTDAANRFDVPIEPLYRANDEAVVPLTASWNRCVR